MIPACARGDRYPGMSVDESQAPARGTIAWKGMILPRRRMDEMSYVYARAKLHGAVLALCGVTSSQAQRLEHALVFNLLSMKPEVDLPAELRDDFQRLVAD